MEILNTLASLATASAVLANVLGLTSQPERLQISSHEISLQNRYRENRSVNEVFKENILLTLAYMEGRVDKQRSPDWSKVDKPFHYEFILKSGEGFAFHDDVLPEHQNIVVKTTNAHFNFQEGFKSSGYLFGDGVCHLASLMYWAAKDAGLLSIAPTNHDFREIPEVPAEAGVSIFSIPGQSATNQLQNLYLVNTLVKSVMFAFDYGNSKLTVTVFSLE